MCAPPPPFWRAAAESKELLTYCIKRVKGLQKVKLVDASFIWTEPHRCAARGARALGPHAGRHFAAEVQVVGAVLGQSRLWALATCACVHHAASSKAKRRDACLAGLVCPAPS